MTSSPVSELIELLSLERLEDNLFRGQSRDIGTEYVFGGQLVARVQLVPSEPETSSHGYCIALATSTNGMVVLERFEVLVPAQARRAGKPVAAQRP